MAGQPTQHDASNATHSASQQNGRSSNRRRGSWRSWLASRLIAMLALLAGLAFFAPMLVGRMELWRPLLRAAAPELAGSINAASVSLSWLSPVEVHGLVVRDTAGQPIADAPLVRSRKRLLDLALNYRDLGTIDVPDARAKVVLRPDGSNLEDFLAKLPKSDRRAGHVQFGILASCGTLELDDQIAGRQWRLENVLVELAWPAAAQQAKTGKLSATINPASTVPANTSPGELAADFSWQPTRNTSGGLGAGQVQLALRELPAELFEGGLKRLVGDIQPQGPITMQAAYAWSQDGAVHRIEITDLKTPALTSSAPARFGSDRPTLVIACGQAAIQIQREQLTIERLELQSNMLGLAAAGTMPLSSFAPAAMVRSASGQIGGEIDLAELARQLPATLRLRGDTQIHSGKLRMTLASGGPADARTWQAEIQSDRLVATTAGRPVRFDEPMVANLAIRQSPQGPVIDRLSARASFLTLDGQGTPSAGSVAARGDLNQLVTELGQLIDWGDTKLAGTLDARVEWSRSDGGRLDGKADALVRNFELTAAGLAPWKEPNLHIAAQARGKLEGAGLAQIDAATLSVESGADRLDVELTEPAPISRSKAESQPAGGTSSVWPVQFVLRGDLATWAPRVQPLVSLGNWQVAGAVDASGRARWSREALELSHTSARVEQLAVEGPALSIREPLVKAEAAGAWDAPHSTLTLTSMVFQSSALALRADGVRVTTGSPPSVVGTIDFRGDLARLSSWLASQPQPRSMELAGAVTGRVEIGSRGQSLAANWNAQAEKFACHAISPSPVARASLASANSEGHRVLVWEEPQVSFHGQALYDPSADALNVQRAVLAATSASIAAAGTLNGLSQAAQADLSGEIAYDLAAITRQIQSLARRRAEDGRRELPFGLDTLQLAGTERRPFVLKGPLFAAAEAPSTGTPAAGTGRVPEALRGEASLGWQSAQYVGLVAGAADIRARLEGGIVQIGPLDVVVSEVRLTTAPRVFLNQPTPAIVVHRGPLIEKVRISPEMCRMWLKYVAPLVAEATRAEGTLSLGLESAVVPVSAPLAGEARGTLAIHSAQIGPGPLAEQYLNAAQRIRALFDADAGARLAVDPTRGWVILPQQDVTFTVKQGAVHHRGLKMAVKDVVITTRGSVNIDTQEIDLTASVPLQENWFKRKDGIFAALIGQEVPIRITGTLAKPRLELSALDKLGSELARSAGQELLRREVGKGLERLFGPLQPPPPPANPPP